MKCSEIVFVKLRWLVLWVNQTFPSCVNCNGISSLFDLVCAKLFK